MAKRSTKMACTSWKYLIFCLLLLLHTGSGREEENDFINLIRNITNIPEQTSSNSVAKSVNSFGYKLLLQMMKDTEDKNIIISPTGVAGLLAMTLLGSVGRSYDELADALGFSRDVRNNRKNHEEFGNLLHSLNGNKTSKTMYADAVLVDTHSTLRDAYRGYLKRVYNGEAISIDFRDRNAAKMSVNNWVSEHTNEKIEDFLKQPLPVDTQAVLLSALYFSGQWEKPFTPEYTNKMPFNKSGSEIMVDLMLNFGEFNYIYSVENDLQIVALPYNDSLTTLYALKPRLPRVTSLKELLSRLDSEKIDKIIEQMTVQKAVIRFPRMDLQGRSNLEEALKGLGIQAIFQTGRANFALMIDNNLVVNKTEDEVLTRIHDNDDLDVKDFNTIINSLPNPGVHIDSIIHDVKININEYGTEAVAATSGILARSAEQFYADSPFYMFIRNEKTKLVTFSAIIIDPTS